MMGCANLTLILGESPNVQTTIPARHQGAMGGHVSSAEGRGTVSVACRDHNRRPIGLSLQSCRFDGEGSNFQELLLMSELP